MPRLLVIGIGNDARADDGLGWLILDQMNLIELQKEYRYQLQIEDAELITHYDTVLFVDATTKEFDAGYAFVECKINPAIQFTTHALDPDTIFSLANDIFPDGDVSAYSLLITGYQWDLGQPMSNKAKDNAIAALHALKEQIFSWQHKTVQQYA